MTCCTEWTVQDHHRFRLTYLMQYRQRVTLDTPKATVSNWNWPMGPRRISNGAQHCVLNELGSSGVISENRPFADIVYSRCIGTMCTSGSILQAPPTVDIDINGSDGPVTITAGDTVVLNLRATNHSLVEFRIDVGAVIGDWTTVTDPSDPYSADVPLTPTFADLTEPATWTFHLRVTGANGDVITDSVVLNILTSTTDSPWSSLVEVRPRGHDGLRGGPAWWSSTGRLQPTRTGRAS